MSYKVGVTKAISDLKDRTGSSLQAIKKAMKANLSADKKWSNSTFLSALKKGVASGELVQNKGSYKLSPAYKKALVDANKPNNPKKKASLKKKPTPKKKLTENPAKKTSKKSPKKATKKTAKKIASKKATKIPAKKATPKKKIFKKSTKKTSNK